MKISSVNNTNLNNKCLPYSKQSIVPIPSLGAVKSHRWWCSTRPIWAAREHPQSMMAEWLRPMPSLEKGNCTGLLDDFQNMRCMWWEICPVHWCQVQERPTSIVHFLLSVPKPVCICVAWHFGVIEGGGLKRLEALVAWVLEEGELLPGMVGEEGGVNEGDSLLRCYL